MSPILHGEAPGPESSMGKLFWSEWYVRATELAMEILGKDGLISKQSQPVADGVPRRARVDDLHGDVGDPAQHPRGARARSSERRAELDGLPTQLRSADAAVRGARLPAQGGAVDRRPCGVRGPDGDAPELYKKMAELGLARASPFPRTHGGLGMSIIEQAVVCEQLGYVNAPSPYFTQRVRRDPAARRAGGRGPARARARGVAARRADRPRAGHGPRRPDRGRVHRPRAGARALVRPQRVPR